LSLYRGRFAPSPTGPLHSGSLFAALVSFLEARSNQGKWLLRIENVDAQREQANAHRSIIETLQAHSLIWDEEISFQSERSHLYEHALKQLADQQYTFQCPCSRKQLKERNGVHLETCNKQTINQKELVNFATKFKLLKTEFSWEDGILGKKHITCQNDFVLKRKEGFYAYQLAVVCDDIAQNITHIVRGSDLLDSTPMQLALYNALKVPPPKFSHFPVLVNSQNQKLSKQTFAQAVNNHTPLKNLLELFTLLKLPLPQKPSTTEEALKMAIKLWDKHYIPATNTLKHMPSV